MADLGNLAKRNVNLFQITKYHFKYTLIPHLLLAVFLLLITPLIFGVAHLDSAGSGIPLELFVSLTGIVLLTPIMAPEQKDGTNDLLSSKYISIFIVWSVRLAWAIAILFILIGLFTFGMYTKACQVSFMHVLGCFISALFLGGLGCLALSVTENIAAAYMVPLLVYGINMAGGKRLGSLYLFSLTLGEWGSKTFMLIAALIFCGAAFLVQKRRRASV
ncbi:MAG: hypothetical protein KHX56_10615 [Clostridiales bacterium]|nr:hypothetical protein [Clostridiales bacterium]